MNVAFLIYNRPELTRRVFETIAAARPERLLVVADGPRDEADVERCRAARDVLEGVRWPCDVRTDFAARNLGCRRRVAGGLTWVFEQVEDAIVLEDDTLPDPTFFRFCAELLERYRADERIHMISGDNFGRAPLRTDESYCFSRYAGGWGWATWKRAWRDYDVDLNLWPDMRKGPWRRQMGITVNAARFLEHKWNEIRAGRENTWDYQWLFAALADGRLSVTPAVNLVSNIGHGMQGTHTFRACPRRSELPRRPMTFPLAHPATVVCNAAVDREYAAVDFNWRRARRRWICARLADRHLYGNLVRRLPLAGAAWKKMRDRA